MFADDMADLKVPLVNEKAVTAGESNDSDRSEQGDGDSAEQVEQQQSGSGSSQGQGQGQGQGHQAQQAQQGQQGQHGQEQGNQEHGKVGRTTETASAVSQQVHSSGKSQQNPLKRGSTSVVKAGLRTSPSLNRPQTTLGFGDSAAVFRPSLLEKASTRAHARSLAILQKKQDVTVAMGDAESLNYHTPYSKLDYQEIMQNVANQRRRTCSSHAIKWVLAAVVGTGVGTVFFGLHTAIHAIGHAKFHLVYHYYDEHHWGKAFLSYWGINMLLALAGTAVLAFLVPAAAGSGIAEIIGYLNGNRIPKAVSFKTFLGKVFCCVMHVASSMPCGPEGPMIHIGGMVGGAFAQSSSKTLGCSLPWLMQFDSDRDRRDFIAIGTACGVAGAFNAPIGGIMLAIDETSSFWDSSLTVRAFVAAMVAVAVANLWAMLETHEYRWAPKFVVPRTTADFTLVQTFGYIVVGVIGGLAGALFVQIVKVLFGIRKKYINPRKWARLLEIAVLCTLCSGVWFSLALIADCRQVPAVLGEGQETVTFVTGECKGGLKQDWASLFLVPQGNQLGNLLLVARGFFPNAVFGAFFPLYLVLTAVVSGATVSAGTLVPCLIAGASYGRLIADAFSHLGPINDGTFAAVGAAAFLAGVTRGRIPVAVIMIELTHELNMLPAVILAVMISVAVADLFNHSVNHELLELKGIPFLEGVPRPELEKLLARDIMSTNVKCLDKHTLVKDVVDCLSNTKHNGFPIVQGEGEKRVCVGFILREELVVLLEARAWLPGNAPSTMQDFVRIKNKLNMRSGFVYKAQVNQSELDSTLDLEPYMHSSAFTVNEDFGAAHAFRLFRGLGLRHITVVNATNDVVGIIARKDLYEDVVKEEARDVEEQLRIRSLQLQMHNASAAALEDPDADPPTPAQPPSTHSHSHH